MLLFHFIAKLKFGTCKLLLTLVPQLAHYACVHWWYVNIDTFGVLHNYTVLHLAKVNILMLNFIANASSVLE